MTGASKKALEKFAAYPKVKAWFDGVGAELKESTRNQYVLFLMRYFAGEDPAPFLKRAQENPREVAIEIKTKLGELHQHSMNAAHLTKYALRSFLEFHEVEVVIKSKVKVRRVREKHELRWDEADRIILEADEPYRSLFNFMRWSGLGEDEFMEIQTSPNIQHKIETQRSNEKPYVKIQLSPRKSALDEFFTLTPKQYVPRFPLNTKAYKDRGAKLIDPHDIQNVWRRAAKKAGLWQMGLGPHTLRSTFRSQCARAGVVRAVSEFCMGHGGGDQYGYSREVLDEQYVASELRKLWAGGEVAKDPLTTGEAKLRATLETTRDPKTVAEILRKILTPEETDAIISLQRQIEAAKKPELREVVNRIEDIVHLRRLALRSVEIGPERERRMKQHQATRRRTARNGGTPLHAPYETRIVSERELVSLLNQGYDLVRELNSGKIIVRKPLDDGQ
jgi:integrase